MAIVRTNPIPPGRYWLDVFTPMPDGSLGEVAMAAWLAENFGRVRVESTESFNGSPHRTWYLFRVISSPTNFPFTKLGFPTIASTAVQHSDDTAHKPPPETVDLSIAAIGTAPLLLILAGVALYALSQTSRR